MTAPAPAVERLRRIANALSARHFGCPVYLVGGALRDPDPRDIDIVVAIPDELFFAMYTDGKPVASWSESDEAQHGWRRWARDCAKQSRELTLYCLRTVDFKTQPMSYFESIDKPREQLNTVTL